MKSIRNILVLIIVAAMVLGACSPQSTPEPAATQAPQQVEPTQPPAPTQAPTNTTAPATNTPAAGDTPAPATNTPEPAPAAGSLSCDQPIKVGLITDATGVLALYGEHIIRSFMLGMEYMAGEPGSAGEVFTIDKRNNNFMVDECEIQVIAVDDASDPTNTATLARELIEVEEVDLIVGTVSSGATATLQGIALENRIPLIVSPAAANDITGVNFNEFTFRVSRNNYQDAINLCQYMTQNYETFVQIAPDYAFGWGGAASFRDACTFYGGEFIADDIFAPATTTDFTPYMDMILASGADAWIVTWAGSGFDPMIKGAIELGVADVMSMGTAFIDNQLMPSFFGDAVGQTSGIFYHYTLPDNEINDWMVEKTVARYGTQPDLFDADGFNAAIFLVEALRATGGSTDEAELREAMEGMEFEGPKGTVYIRPEDHVAIQDMYIVTLLNVTDPEKRFYELVEVTRPEPPCLLPENLQDRCGDLPVGSLQGE